MLKLASDLSEPDSPALVRPVTWMRPAAVTGPGAAQVQVRIDPLTPMHPGTFLKLAPPSVEYFTSKELIGEVLEA
ncbi:hypothetical protein, partial [Salmonella sp. SAL4446]|uniref:hypothetical protein n=1 Tax=Salmonella sp. SAL4446 TaxID=3159901 RepID=UPI00397A5E10